MTGAFAHPDLKDRVSTISSNFSYDVRCLMRAIVTSPMGLGRVKM